MNGYIFEVAIDEMCAIGAPGTGALILDLRAFSGSSMELERDPFRQANHLQPIYVLESRGFGEVESLLMGQELQGFEAAIRGWKEVLSLALFSPLPHPFRVQ